MPDISMCNNSKCPSCNRCYRFTATPSDFYQTYGAFEVEEGEEKCEYFWEDIDSSEFLLKLINRVADKDSLRKLKEHILLQDNIGLLNKYYSKLLTFGTRRGEYKEEKVYYDLDYVTHNRSMFIANNPNGGPFSSEITNSNFWEKLPFHDYEGNKTYNHYGI